MRQLALAICAAAAATPLAAAAAAPAAAGGAAADARCLVAMAAFTSSTNQDTARAAQAGVVYFAGRIKAEDPSFDLGARLKAVAAGMTPQTLQTEAQQRCGPQLMATMRELDAAQRAFGPPAGAAKPKAPAGSSPPPKR
jgi:hypothetical protein